MGCSEDPGITGATHTTAPATGSPEEVTTGAPSWTREPLRTAPEAVYGYTHGQPSGNRVAEGEGGLLETRPVDVELGGEPVWVVGVPLGEGTGWVVAL